MWWGWPDVVHLWGRELTHMFQARKKPTTQAHVDQFIIAYHSIIMTPHRLSTKCVLTYQLMDSQTQLTWTHVWSGPVSHCGQALSQGWLELGINFVLLNFIYPLSDSSDLVTKHWLCQTRTLNMAYNIVEDRMYIACSYVHLVIIYYCYWFCEPSSFSNWDNLTGIIVSLFLKYSCPALTSWAHQLFAETNIET